MAREKYTITDEDRFYAHKWIEKKLKFDFGFIDDVRQSLQAEDELREAWSDADSLNAWCEKYLSKKQWQQLKNAIRAARQRKGTRLNSGKRKRSIDIDPHSHAILSHIAKRDGVTLSEVITKYLKDEWLK